MSLLTYLINFLNNHKQKSWLHGWLQVGNRHEQQTLKMHKINDFRDETKYSY